ncbi:hypothetical protein JCM10213_005354 [Rhodosporidiobolus nylandii]
MAAQITTPPSPPSPTAPPAPSAEGPAASPPSAQHDDSPACRICLEVPDDSLARLLVPCRCSGTARFVHEHCLNSWRNSHSAGFDKCTMCGAAYRFRKTRWTELAASRAWMHLLSLSVLLLFGAAVGFAAEPFMQATDEEKLQFVVIAWRDRILEQPTLLRRLLVAPSYLLTWEIIALGFASVANVVWATVDSLREATSIPEFLLSNCPRVWPCTAENAGLSFLVHAAIHLTKGVGLFSLLLMLIGHYCLQLTPVGLFISTFLARWLGPAVLPTHTPMLLLYWAGSSSACFLTMYTQRSAAKRHRIFGNRLFTYPQIVLLVKLQTDGSGNNLVLWDLRPLGLTGSKIEKICDMAHITLRRDPGGVRIGSNALTSRSMKDAEMSVVADMLHRAVQIGLKAQSESGSRLLKDFVAKLEGDGEAAQQLKQLKQGVHDFAD